MHLRNHLTVATIVERGGKFLCVWEEPSNKLVFNQPAGHVEPGENVIDAAVRETLEETGVAVKVDSFLGFYKSISDTSQVAYYRLVFVGKFIKTIPNFKIDPDIKKVEWLTLSEINDPKNTPRSQMTRKSFNDYRMKPSYPLTIFTDE